MPILDTIATSYQTASSGWYATLFPYAQTLFWLLATIELCWSALLWTIARDEMDALTGKFLKKIISIGFFYAILLQSNNWIPAIIDSFAYAGANAAHVTQGASAQGISPSEVLTTGISTAGALFSGYGNGGLLGNIAAGILAVIAGTLIVAAHAVIAGQLLIALVESYIAISAGVLFLGFGGSRWTVDFTQKQISFAFATGVKLFILYLIIGIGQTQATSWGALLHNTDLTTGSGFNVLFSVMGGSLVYMMLAWVIPSLAAAQLSGTPNLTAGAAALTMVSSVGALGGAAALTAGHGLAAVKGSASLAKAAGAAFTASRAEQVMGGKPWNSASTLAGAAKHFGKAAWQTRAKGYSKGERMAENLQGKAQEFAEQAVAASGSRDSSSNTATSSTFGNSAPAFNIASANTQAHTPPGEPNVAQGVKPPASNPATSFTPSRQFQGGNTGQPHVYKRPSQPLEEKLKTMARNRRNPLIPQDNAHIPPLSIKLNHTED